MVAHKCTGMYKSCRGCGSLLEFDRFDIECPDAEKPIKETIIPLFEDIMLPRRDLEGAREEAKKRKYFWAPCYITCPICGRKERVMMRSFAIYSFEDVELWSVGWTEAFQDLISKGDKTLVDLVANCEACPSGDEVFEDDVEFFVEM